MDEPQQDSVKRETFYIRSFFIGLASCFVYLLSLRSFPIFGYILSPGINSISLVIIWGIVILLVPLLFKAAKISYSGFSVMIFVYLGAVFTIMQFRDNNLFSDVESPVLYTRVTTSWMGSYWIIAGIFGLLNAIYNEVTLRKRINYVKQNSHTDSRTHSFYKAIAIFVSFGLAIHNYLNISSFRWDSNIFDIFAIQIIVLVASGILFFIFLNLDFNFFKSLIFTFDILFMIACVYAFGNYFVEPIIRITNPHLYSSFLARGYTDHEAFLIGFVMFVLIFNLGSMIVEIPYHSRYDRYARYRIRKSRRKRRKKRRKVRKFYKLVRKNPEKYGKLIALKYQELLDDDQIPKAESQASAPNTSSNQTYIPQFQEYQVDVPEPKTSEKEEKEAILLEEKIKPKHNLRQWLSRMSFHSIPIFQNDEEFSEFNNIWAYRLHYFLNKWLSSNTYLTFISIIVLWLSHLALNSFHWMVDLYIYIPVGIVFILSLIWIFLSPSNFDFGDPTLETDKNFSYKLFIGLISLNALLSIVIPFASWLIIIVEAFFITPFLSFKLKNYQKIAIQKQSMHLDLLIFLKLILWEVLAFSLIFNNRGVVQNTVLYGALILIPALYFGLEFGWRNAIVPILMDFMLTSGLSFIGFSFGYSLRYNIDNFWLNLSLIVFIPIFLVSGLIFHVYYLKIKTFEFLRFDDVSNELNAFLNKIEEIKNTQSEVGKNFNQQNEVVTNTSLDAEEQQIIDQFESMDPTEKIIEMLCPICHMKIPLGDDEIAILKHQNYIFCPNCSERVFIKEILEPSHNSLILEHKKIMQDFEKQQSSNKQNNESHSNHESSTIPSNGR